MAQVWTPERREKGVRGRGRRCCWGCADAEEAGVAYWIGVLEWFIPGMLFILGMIGIALLIAAVLP